MGGAGAIDSMNKSFKYNRALLGQRKSLKELYQEMGYSYKKGRAKFCRAADPALLRQIRHQIRKQKRITIIKSFVVLTVALTVVGLVYARIFMGLHIW